MYLIIQNDNSKLDNSKLDNSKCLNLNITNCGIHLTHSDKRYSLV